jgi:hypothetical protein
MKYGSRFIAKGSTLISRLTTATNIAIKTEKAKPKITHPLEYSQFASVFSETTSTHLSPSCPYNHAIYLDETFVPQIGKIYPLSPDEQKATEDFLKENLHSRKI